MTTTVRSYQELTVWQRVMDLVVECYRITRRFPTSELYGLPSQLQRAAVSIPANLAEGQGRRHTPELIQHLYIAYGSWMELETHIQIAQRLSYISKAEALSTALSTIERSKEVGRLLNGLLRSLRNKPTPKSTDH